jgi:predicted CopG family antitoxin
MSTTSNKTKFKHITVNERTYFALKELGKAADSFNDVITELLNSKKQTSAGKEPV